MFVDIFTQKRATFVEANGVLNLSTSTKRDAMGYKPFGYFMMQPLVILLFYKNPKEK